MITNFILKPVMPFLNYLRKVMGETIYRYFTNISWGILERVFRMIAGFVVGILIARHLGPEQFGLLNYIASIVFLFSGLATFGLDSVIVRDLARTPEKHNEIMGTSLAIRLVLSAVSIICLGITVLYIERDRQTQLLILVAGLSLVLGSFQNIASFFEAAVWWKKASLSRMAALAVTSALRIYWILIDQNLAAFVITTVVETALTSLLFVVTYARTHSALRWKFDRWVFRSLMKDGWKMVAASLGVLLYMKIDQVMITQMLGAQENGVYSVAVRMSEIWYFIPTIICSAVYPVFVQTSSNKKLYRAQFRKLFDFLFVISAVILVGTLLLSDWFISTFFGEAYAAAAPCLKIHIFGILFVFTGVAASKWVLTEGTLIYTAVRTLVAAAVNIVLNFLLMYDYGIQGAAVATVIAQVLSSYLFYLVIPRYRELFILQTGSLILPLRALAKVIHGKKAD